MCGICGFSSNIGDPTLNRQAISAMLDSMHHRGPDDEGVLEEPDIVLGVRRLSIIDLSRGHQPIHNEDSTVFVVFNGEIYNYLSLREDLEKKGHLFYTSSNTEVIVHLYEEYAESCVDKLNGMFSFAIWDKGNKKLFLARDRFGIKPLYYCEFNGGIIFASEIKAILKFPGFSSDLDPEALDLYLTFEYIPSPHSIFRRIKKLPAAHYLIYRNKNIVLKKFWDINFVKKGKFEDENEIKDRLLMLLKGAVRSHLASDVPLGFFLSGGIDSSSIVAIANAYLGQRAKTFSVGFQEPSFDETEYILRISRKFNSEHHQFLFTAKDLLCLLPEVITFLDEPIADASIFPTYFLSKMARKDVKVALSGEGADELFAGYPTYLAHRIFRYYNCLPRFLKENILNKAIESIPVSMKDFSLDFKLKRFISVKSASAAIRHIYWMGSFAYEDKIKLYTNDTLSVRDCYYPEKLIDNLIAGPVLPNELAKLQYLDIKTYLQDDLLVKADRAGMAASLEIRVPYLDNELSEFVFGIPDDLKLRGFKTKYILKKALFDFLPQEIINRSKKGFGIPLALWMKTELKQLICDILDKNTIDKEGLFNYQYIDELLRQHFEHKKDNRKKIWTLLMFELWRRNYLK